MLELNHEAQHYGTFLKSACEKGDFGGKDTKKVCYLILTLV